MGAHVFGAAAADRLRWQFHVDTKVRMEALQAGRPRVRLVRQWPKPTNRLGHVEVRTHASRQVRVRNMTSSLGAQDTLRHPMVP